MLAAESMMNTPRGVVKRLSIRAGFVRVADSTEGAPHFLDDLHVRGCRFQRVGRGTYRVDRRVSRGFRLVPGTLGRVARVL